MKDNIGVYIHIPFCTSKCYYCDFTSYCNVENKIEQYIKAICYEILQNSEILSSYNISSIYIGGGTPSYIDACYIKQIMDTLNLFRDNSNDIEITIEVNPNSATYEKILMYKNIGINRISVGLQSTHDSILKTIGRKHSYKDELDCLKNIKKANITNVSLDLIYPLPNLTYEMFNNTLNEIVTFKKNYNIKHISIYNLEVHKGTKLDFLLKEGYLSLPNEETEYNMKCLLEETLLKNNLLKYEISNYSLSGFESKHNLNYWNQGMYLGFGSGASSFFGGSRYTNIKDLDKYIEYTLSNDNIIDQREDLDKLALIKEYIILRLRLKFGVNIKQFKKRFEKDIFELFKPELDELKKSGLIDMKKDEIYLTKRGFEVANVAFLKFI